MLANPEYVRVFVDAGYLSRVLPGAQQGFWGKDFVASDLRDGAEYQPLQGASHDLRAWFSALPCCI